MARLTAENVDARRARSSPATRVPEVGARSRCCTWPRSRTATSPTTPWSTSPSCVGVTPAEVLGTGHASTRCSSSSRSGKYVVNVCTNISCHALGGDELLEHAEETLGVKAGGTTADGVFTLEDVECIAACTEAPCLQVNYRYRHQVTHDDVRPAGRRPARRPARRRDPAARHAGPRAPAAIPADRAAGAGRRRRRASSRCGCSRQRRCRGGRGADDHHRRAQDRHRPLRPTTTPTPSTRYQATGGYEGLRKALEP